jgi:transcriptional regulator with XRE-family HTH domain
MRKAATPLENLRRTRTLSQQQLAKVLGVSQQTFSKYEKGKLMPSPDMQARIAAVLGVARHELFPEAIAS